MHVKEGEELFSRILCSSQWSVTPGEHPGFWSSERWQEGTSAGHPHPLELEPRVGSDQVPTKAPRGSEFMHRGGSQRSSRVCVPASTAARGHQDGRCGARSLPARGLREIHRFGAPQVPDPRAASLAGAHTEPGVMMLSSPGACAMGQRLHIPSHPIPVGLRPPGSERRFGQGARNSTSRRRGSSSVTKLILPWKHFSF